MDIFKIQNEAHDAHKELDKITKDKKFKKAVARVEKSMNDWTDFVHIVLPNKTRQEIHDRNAKIMDQWINGVNK